MPYYLSPVITQQTPGLWREGQAYQKEAIFSLDVDASKEERSAPVNYSLHMLKPHSLPHMEAPKHVLADGASIDSYFDAAAHPMWGRCEVVRLKRDALFQEVSQQELAQALGGRVPQRLLLTLDDYPQNEHGFHDPDKVLVLSEAAARWLCAAPHFCVYGTSWKSTDFRPGSKERPIHRIFFDNDVAIYECLELSVVPDGAYLFVGPPLRLKDASESPVCPMLFTREEWLAAW